MQGLGGLGGLGLGEAKFRVSGMEGTGWRKQQERRPKGQAGVSLSPGAVGRTGAVVGS